MGRDSVAYILFDEEGNEIKRSSKGFLGVTNNFCEQIAIVSAMMSVPDNAELTIITDLKFCIGYFGRNDLHTKINNVARLWCEHIGNKKIIFKWVKGHNGDKYNEECDKMAGERMLEIRKKYNIPTYSTKNSPKVKRKNY